MGCPSYPANASALNDILSNFPGNDTCEILQAVTCGGLLGGDICTAICPNQDLAGIGVRLAFYFQSLVTALLVKFSPADSVPTAWAGTLLTTSLVVAAIVQKASGQLTLHHATLVLNFATLSCISSLAVAPTLPIWKLSPVQYSERERDHHALTLAEDEASKGLMKLIQTSFYNHVHRKQAKAAQERARVVLSLAILLQVVMQWAWAIFLFVSPYYGQPECSGDTVIIMFLAPFTTREINSFDGNGIHFLIWPMWLLFCVGVTLVLTIILAVSSSFRAEELSRASASLTTGATPATPAGRAWARMVMDTLYARHDKRQWFVFFCYFWSFVIWGMFVAASELQKVKNRIFSGENDFGGLGQITAVFVSLVPLWSLSVALYKYPSLRRRRKRHEAQRQHRASGGASRSTSMAPPARRSYYAHAPHPSDASDSGAQGFEMQAFAIRGLDGFARHAYSPVPSGVPDSPPVSRRVRHGPREMTRRTGYDTL